MILPWIDTSLIRIGYQALSCYKKALTIIGQGLSCVKKGYFVSFHQVLSGMFRLQKLLNMFHWCDFIMAHG
jgi:hypothetical protein